MTASAMAHRLAEPAPPPRRWRYVPVVAAVVLVGAWLALSLAHLARPTTVDDVSPRDLGYRIRVNHDDPVKLQLLSGVGPRLADYIAAHRQQHGPFQSLEQLEQVHRIGPRTVERIEPWLTLDAPPPASHAPSE